MKELTVLLLAMLLAALPLMGLMEDTTAAEAPVETPAETPAAQAPRWGWRWNQNQEQAQPPFVDENQDGVCDTCGQTPGQNPAAPGFTDEDQDGVCDHYVPGVGPGFQGRSQAQGRMPMMRGRMMMGRGRMAQGRMGGRRGGMQGPQGRGAQGPSFLDENQDGICDRFNPGTAQPWNTPGFGPGRNRR